MQGVVVKSEVDEEVFKLAKEITQESFYMLQAQLQKIIVLT